MAQIERYRVAREQATHEMCEFYGIWLEQYMKMGIQQCPSETVRT